MNDYIREYRRAMEEGHVTVGRWVRLLYERIEAGRAAGEYRLDAEKADRAIRFVEGFCHHSRGRSDLLKLELWQKAALSLIFGLVEADGRRYFREVVLVVGRKNGKTLLASAVMACCLYLDGEYGAEIYCVAPKLDQADIVYSCFGQTVLAEPELAALTRRRKSDYYVAQTNSTVKKIAFSAKKSDGYNPHLAICDEIASWPGEAGLRQYDVLKSGRGSRRQPLLLSLSTSGYTSDGVYDELLRRSTRLLLGDSREKRLLPLLYQIDDVERWDDRAELAKANPNLGVSVPWAYLEEELAIARESLPAKAEFLAKYCNVRQNSSQAWVSAQAVEKACGPSIRLEELRGCYCVGGIDLSRTTDLTACCVVVEKDGRLHVLARFFLPAARLADAQARDNLPYDVYVRRGLLQPSGESFVDYHDCFAWFCQLVERWQLYPLQVGYDRYTAQYLVQQMQQYGFHMDDVYQGTNLTPVLREVEGLLNDGRLNIGDNDLLKMHLLDTAVRIDADSGRLRPVKLQANAHIDGAAALLDAMAVRQKWFAEIGGQLRNGPEQGGS